MKKILYSVLLLCGFCGAFTSCEDDHEANPTLMQPTSFLLQAPVPSDEVVNLETAAPLAFAWQQPAYGYQAVAHYYLQLSVNGQFTHSVAEAEADESGKTVADYISSSEMTMACSQEYPAAEIAKMLQKLCKWNKNEVPARQEVYARIYASIPVSGGVQPAVGCVASNVVQFQVAPVYVELKDALPDLWYLIGDAIGDGTWSNDPTAVGRALIPMNVIKNYAYDKKTGAGEITYTGYFESKKGFKLIHVPGSWEEQWGQDGDFGSYRKKDADGEGSNIIVPANGYYTVRLDTRNDVLTIDPAEITPAVYEKMYFTGDFAGWAETDHPMQAVSTTVSKNHLWSFQLDATAGPTGCRFLQPGGGLHWGGAGFPYGIGENTDAKIPVPQGKYTVIFNDIDGAYTFVAQP